MSLAVYFPVIFQSESQFLIYNNGVPVLGTWGLPTNTRLYPYHPVNAHNAFAALKGVLFDLGVVLVRNDRQIAIAMLQNYTLKLAATADAPKLARLLGLYGAGPPLDLGYYQNNMLATLDPCGVTLQAVFPGDIGYVHEAYDLSGAPDWPAIHVVSDTGAAAQIAGDARRLLSLSLRALPGALFSPVEAGSFAATFTATFWQAYNPRYSAPYMLIVEDDRAYEYALRRPIQAADAKPTRENWHGHFHLELELQQIGEWAI